MFGNRSLGGPTSLGSSSGLASGLNGLGGAGVGTGLGQTGTAGQLSGGERFLRDNRTAGQFVGSDNADSSFVGAMSGASGNLSGMNGRGLGMGGSSNLYGMGGLGGGGLGGNFLGGMGGLGGLGGGLSGRFGGGLGGNFGLGQQGRNNQRMGQFGRNGNMNMNSNRNRAINTRTTLSVGFRYRETPAAQVQTQLSERLNEVRLGRLESLQVSVQDGVATLRGRVASQDDRDLARRIARMEPGVESVVDELTIDAPNQDASSPSDQP
jgi:osmotically-inducible protein OsmY